MRHGLERATADRPTGHLGGRAPRRTVVVVGAGAAGTLTAIQLLDGYPTGPGGTGYDAAALHIVLVDPAPAPGRGVAYGTDDRRHLLNVPARGMSARPGEPGHFVAWLRREVSADLGPDDFAARADYARYLAATLAERLDRAPACTLEHRCTTVLDTRPMPGGVHLDLADGDVLSADAVVLAPGIFAPGTGWAPESLRTSDRFVADPWAPGALEAVDALAGADGEVLLVGTGLTMVDLALTLGGPGRTLHAVSRRGRLPAAHVTHAAARPVEPGGSLADMAAGRAPADLDRMRAELRRVVLAAVRGCGDWRAAFDLVRPITGDLWSRLSPDERADFIHTDAAWWDLHRHRMPPTSAAAIARLRASGALRVGSDEVLAVEASTDGLLVRLASGRQLTVAAVVNCTGPRGDVRLVGDPLLDNLLAAGTAVPGPLGLGLRTQAGRLVDRAGSHRARIWTLGAMRRGELWETTAVPEIRAQAAEVATAVLATFVQPAARRRQARDLMDLPVTTTPEAAAAFNRGLDAVMRVQSGAAEAFSEAAELDPGFALAHGALAMLGHEGGADAVDVRTSLDAARSAVRDATERERSLVEVIDARVRDCRGGGATALVRHVHAHPRDVLAVSAAVPTIAFSGVTDVGQESWDLVEGLAPAYAGHWWYHSLLAFVRQDQTRYDEAGQLSESVLALEPAAGHAVHARTHVFYETGAHEAGLRWLDPWITTCGRQASHRAHFSWHAALHELSTGDAAAVRRRYLSQLAPPAVTGVRGLVDSASLLWRCQVTDSWTGHVPVEEVLAHAGADLVERPTTPFTALHAAVALTAAGDAARLRRLTVHARSAADPVLREVVAPLCIGLVAVVEERWDDAVTAIRPLLTRLTPVGGSLAQREIIEDTYLHALVGAGRCAEAVALIDARLDRRPSPLDRRRRMSALAG